MPSLPTDQQELDRAIEALRQAGPTPEAVEKLASDTIGHRNNPHTFASVFVRDFGGRLICQLCGMVSQDPYQGPSKHPAVAHLEWHNALHRADVVNG